MENQAMRGMLLSSAAVLALLAVPAAAQNSNTIEPNKLRVEAKRPPLQLNDQHRAGIQNALVAEHAQQKAPKDFKPQVGATPPKGIKIDAMPQALARQLPVLKEYGYAKTATDILVIDPMSMRIVALIPRKYPNDANAKSPTPAEWWQSHAPELTGRAPQDASSSGQSPDQAGDAAAVGNGNATNAQPQDSGLQPGYQNQR
jgi:hypothetical protein